MKKFILAGVLTMLLSLGCGKSDTTKYRAVIVSGETKLGIHIMIPDEFSSLYHKGDTVCVFLGSHPQSGFANGDDPNDYYDVVINSETKAILLEDPKK